MTNRLQTGKQVPMKVAAIKSKEQVTRSIRFLKENRSCNLYLYEGLSRLNFRYHNLCFSEADECMGVLHTKSGTNVHILLSEIAAEDAVNEILKIALRRFGGIRSFFGDHGSIKRLTLENRAGQGRFREYEFMETDRKRFLPGPTPGGVVPKKKDAPLLLPLQRQYEIEEMRYDPTLLDSERMTVAFARRIDRGEITALYEKGRPVAIAGVNARYGEVCQIGSVYVVPSYRRKGYGYRVVSSHVSRLFRRYGKIVLFVDVENRTACRLYEMLGFEKSGMLAQVEVIEN